MFNLPAREQYSMTGSSGTFPFFGTLNPYKAIHKRFAWTLGVDKESVACTVNTRDDVRCSSRSYRAMKRDVKTVAGWDFDRIIPCHGVRVQSPHHDDVALIPHAALAGCS